MFKGGKWTPEEVSRMNELRRQGKSRGQIAQEMGRSLGSIIARLNKPEKVGSRGITGRRLDKIAGYVPPSAIEEREYAMGIGHRDMTAELMGDPLPGRSALERK